MNTDISGYHPFVYKLRSNNITKESNRGGGVGCWVREMFCQYHTFSIKSIRDVQFHLRNTVQDKELQSRNFSATGCTNQSYVIFSFIQASTS